MYKGKGSKDDVCNYRPISLLSIIRKVAERCVYNHIILVLSDDIYKLQHGFLKERSTVTQLTQFFHEIGSIIDVKGQVDVLYLDFSKAFDSVPHDLLILKLNTFGFTGKLLKWFESYLYCRQQRAVISGCKSGWLKVTSGVPQGSILRPFLFLLYINDLPMNIKNSIFASFADDCKAFKHIKIKNDCYDFQKDIDSFYFRAKKLLMNFNVLKCHVITITNNKAPVIFCYKMNDVPLKRVTELVDLGINVDSTLSWSPHIHKIVNKANKVYGLIKRTLGWHAPQQTKYMLHCALARPLIEYCTPLWSGTSFTNVRLVERVQRSMTRYICNFSADIYKERLIKLNILPLTMKREQNDVIFFWKCLRGIYETDVKKIM